MGIKFYFVGDGKNFYSISPLYALLSNIDDVIPEIIPYKSIGDFCVPDGAQCPIVFAFSFNTISFMRQAETVKRFIQDRKSDNVIFLAGGSHPSARPRDMLGMGFDAVITGSGEEALIDLVTQIKNGLRPAGIKRKKIGDLDLYPPFPEKQYHYKPIEITRGCPYGCFFCQTSYLFSKKPVHRSVENILCYVQKAFSQRIKDFRFISPNALAYGAADGRPDERALKRMLDGVRDIIGTRGRIFFGTFPSEIRPEFAGRKIMKYLKSVVDNKRVIIGAQTGSGRMLKACNRGHTLKDVENAIENCLYAGFKIEIDIIVGMPGEEASDYKKTMDFIYRHESHEVKFHFHYFIPLPGTPWQNKKPVSIPPQLRTEIERLVGKGKAWGTWEHQKRIQIY